MTLSRLFDPDDRGLLLAVARSADGTPAAFCQFVPAPAINGWSLDVMRRSIGEHPNGLVDFLVVETIRHVQATGGTGLGLNFAALRAVLAGETGSRIERRLLEQLSETMQIESLWRFNAKFHPDWHPRYLVVDGAEHLPATGAAVARAESLWELPLLGRLLRRSGREVRGPEPVGRAAVGPASVGPAPVGPETVVRELAAPQPAGRKRVGPGEAVR
jgi:lysylphosphatidylglycerol synthetase-like protein (DUF2156 family)